MGKTKVKSKTKLYHNTKDKKSKADHTQREQQQNSVMGTSSRTLGSKRKARKNRGAGTTTTTMMAPVVATTPVTTPPVSKEDDGAGKGGGAQSREAMSKKMSREPPSTRTSKAPPPQKAEPPAWIGAPVAKTWMDKAEFSKTKSEFEAISNMAVDIEKDCKKWKANHKDNQSDDFPALDSKLVQGEEYVNISHVDVPLHRNLLIGQIPKAGTEEAFWKAVFDQRAMCIHLLIGDGEKFEFFPQRSGDFMHYGSMFVNNRRVEGVNDDIVRFAIEVLPSGCSNSIITNFTVIKNWNLDSVHAKYACVLKETIELNNFLSTSQADETALVMSKHGAGRAGYFIALTIAVTQMDQKIEPNVLDIVKAIRAQRPRSVDSLPQYASLYISLFYLIKRKMSKTPEGDKKAAPDTSDPLCKKAMQLTNQFVNGLVEEANANAAKSALASVRK